MISGIYAILNTENDKYYIGSAVNLQDRWKQHKSRLTIGDHHNKHLQNAWIKYGKSKFIFVVLEYTDAGQLFEKEQKWIDNLNANDKLFGYNKRLSAESNRGMKPSEETKRKMSETQKGKKLSESHIAALRGRKFSEQGKLNISKASTGRKLSKESRAKVSIALKARVRTPETHEKIRQSVKKSWEVRKSFKLTEAPMIIA